MKAILIDVHEMKVKEIEIAATDSRGRLDAMYELMKCEMVDAPYVLSNEDTLYIDDNGLYNQQYRGFQTTLFKSVDLPEPVVIRGSALLLGTDEKGASKDVQTTVEMVRATTVFWRMANDPQED